MAQAQSKPNWFVIGISAAVVVVLIALGAIVVWMNSRATDAGPAPSGDLINSETGAIVFGDGDNVVDTYIDLMCPACNAFEQTFAERLNALAADDTITLNIHPIAILDHYSAGSNYSSRAAAAVYCVAEKNSDKTLDYISTLYENQPDENTTGLSDEQLADYAEQVGATEAAACMSEGTYLKYPAAQAKAHKIQGTPTIELDGDAVEGQSLQEMFAKVDAYLKPLE
ncbi:DsbA family protein [Microbacterium suwonense]|uniref:Membrane protein n=1 Tax=Microbacterium suwonense TaxID=683047 RepID=A0ABM8FY07_9MICO|nr:thioredoxin domain-containing protein [Microbacterium suwonense]BDZ40631.1 membrane protein [Microbacterium suwonense]